MSAARNAPSVRVACRPGKRSVNRLILLDKDGKGGLAIKIIALHKGTRPMCPVNTLCYHENKGSSNLMVDNC